MKCSIYSFTDDTDDIGDAGYADDSDDTDDTNNTLLLLFCCVSITFPLIFHCFSASE